MNSEMRFWVASIYREKLDKYVPNELPLYLYLEKGKSKSETGSYFWIKSHFVEMMNLILKGESVHTNGQFMNL
jgi:GTPase Era involved in 16S rRNA processing